MLDAGSSPRDVWVCSRLCEAGESVTRTDLAGLAAGHFDPLSVVVFVAPGLGVAPTAATGWGKDEALFAHRAGLITKAEVRAVVLGKLELPPHGVLWDVGAGSGSVGIEAARLVPGLRVFSIERDRDAAAQIDANAIGTAAVVVNEAAPAAFRDLPDPDRLFVGGGGIAVLEAALERLRPGGVAVATYATLGPALDAAQRLGRARAIAGQPGRTDRRRWRVAPARREPCVRRVGLTMTSDRVLAVSITHSGAELAGRLPYEHAHGEMARTVHDNWTRVDAFVLFCATGIAVRIVGPLLRDKKRDPAVVCVDEAGRFAIALCGGHGAGANDLARDVAALVGARPVVTTATDAMEMPALDELPGFVASGTSRRVARAWLDGLPPRVERTLEWPVPVRGRRRSSARARHRPSSRP